MIFRKLFILSFIILAVAFASESQNLKGITICVNPGHGGYDSDDRNMVIYPFTLGDKNGFWESKSNLDKGFHLRNLLKGAGANVIMTRTTNEHSEAGGNADTPLSAIVEMANANSADYMIAIHSNAGGNNMILMLYSGIDDGDTYNYSHPAPFRVESRQVAEKFASLLYTNKISQWTSAPSVRGDKTFARLVMGWSNGYGVLRNLIVPGVISEGSMHDYIPETYRLMNMDYKKLEAWHFFKAFCQQYNGGTQNIGRIAGWVKDKDRNFLSAFPGSPGYFALPGTPDNYKPLNGTKITLLKEGVELRNYTTDNLYNGVYAFDSLAQGTYTLRYEKEKYTTKELTAEVKPFEVTYTNCTLSLDRSNPLSAESFYPKVTDNDSVATSVKVKINFNFELNRTLFENAFSITPAIQGTFEYSNFDKTVTFIPAEPYNSRTLYEVKIDKSAAHIGNVPMESDLIFSFFTRTPRYLTLLDWYPKEGDVVFPNTQVKLFFDRPINNSGMNTKVVVKDENNQEISGEGFLYNDFSSGLGDYQFRLPALAAGKSYTLTISKNVFDNDTLMLPESQNIRFSTGNYVTVDNQYLKDNFETINLWKIDTENSTNLSGTNNMVRYSTVKYAGSYSYRLLYKFSQPENAKIQALYRNPGIIVNNKMYAGCFIFGDLTFNNIEMVLVNGLDTAFVPVTILDYAGWKFVETNLSTLKENADFTLSGFRLKCTGSKPQSTEGGVMFDNIYVYNTSVSGFNNLRSENGIKVFPVPATNEINLILDNLNVSENTHYSILNVNGQIVSEGILSFTDNNVKINISPLQAGMYFLKLKTQNGTKHVQFIKKMDIYTENFR